MPEIHNQRINPLIQKNNENNSSTEQIDENKTLDESISSETTTENNDTNDNTQTVQENVANSESTTSNTTSTTKSDAPKTKELIFYWTFIIILSFIFGWFVHGLMPKIMKLKETKKYSKATVIQTKKELKDAMLNKPKIYIIDSIPVNGIEVTDDLGVFATKHLAMTFDKFVYTKHYDKNTKKTTHYWKYRPNLSLQFNADKLKLFGEIEVDCTDVRFNLSTIPNISDITAENQADYNKNGDFQEKYLLLMPDSKFELRVLNNDQEVSFLALIGDNKVSVQPNKDRKEIKEGSRKGLIINTSYVVASIIFWLLVIGFWFFAIIFYAVGIGMTVMYIKDKNKA